MARTYRSARAETDLIEIWTTIAGDDPAAADRLLNRIERACVLLATRTPGTNVMILHRVCVFILSAII
jgi:plasmid stabilization system protein ParE